MALFRNDGEFSVNLNPWFEFEKDGHKANWFYQFKSKEILRSLKNQEGLLIMKKSLDKSRSCRAWALAFTFNAGARRLTTNVRREIL
jgi:hypothetical protein